MTTIETTELASVHGGARGQSREQIAERYKNICKTGNARAQYDTMLTQMVPDTSEAPGFKRRVVKAIGELCHWPFPGAD
jgi:hypothetical protein